MSKKMSKNPKPDIQHHLEQYLKLRAQALNHLHMLLDSGVCIREHLHGKQALVSKPIIVYVKPEVRKALAFLGKPTVIVRDSQAFPFGMIFTFNGTELEYPVYSDQEAEDWNKEVLHD